MCCCERADTAIDASRFLAQSQSRVGFGPREESPRNPLQRNRRQQDQTSSRFQSTRSYLQRPTLGNPYTAGASIAQFPFASRSVAPSAPLFYSATDQFREEDDEEEHQREIDDFYALQRSRRQFGGSHLEESSEADEDDSRGSGVDDRGDGRDADERGRAKSGGIRSSWLGDRTRGQGREGRRAKQENKPPMNAREQSEVSGRSRGNLVDVGLDSIAPSAADGFDGDEPPDDLAIEIPPDDPPSIQQFRTTPKPGLNIISPFIPQETSPRDVFSRPPPPESDVSSPPPTVSSPTEEPPRHDPFWASLYLISVAALFASFVLVYLHTTAPSRKNPLGDTVYTTLHGSYHLLAVDTLIAVIVSLLWLAILRSYVRPLVYLILVAVPIILFSFFLYPLIASYQGKYHGASIQDKAMRWFAFIPGALAVLWSFSVWKGRHSLNRAIRVLEFSCRVLAANPGLLIVGFATLVAVITWTWVWMAMFTRVFLGGHISPARHLYIIDFSTWWLAIFFILVYIWTLGIFSGIQRATTAATVSQWYFHRLAVPAPSSQEVIRAAIGHAVTNLFGTICFSSFLAIAIRLPFLLFPRRAASLAGLCSYTVLPSTIATLTNPLTLTYAAIHSQPLVTSSRSLARLSFVSSGSRQGAAFQARNTPSQTPLHSYTLSLLLLRATRFVTALALGFGAWVSTARSLSLGPAPGGGAGATANLKGSLYAYIVGLIAAAIGWAVMGAIDGVVAGIVDAGVVCWGSEIARPGGRRYCVEAEGVFGDGDEAATQEEGRGFLR